jgi:cell division protein FtsW (lipid II flippase)
MSPLLVVPWPARPPWGHALIDLGFFNLQPSEIMKIVIIITLA